MSTPLEGGGLKNVNPLEGGLKNFTPFERKSPRVRPRITKNVFWGFFFFFFDKTLKNHHKKCKNMGTFGIKLKLIVSAMQ